jgi:hypothetical protein
MRRFTRHGHTLAASLVIVSFTAVAHPALAQDPMTDVARGYRMTALSERSSPVSVETTSTQGASTVPELTLDESAWAFAQHKNKFGTDYPSAAYQR